MKRNNSSWCVDKIEEKISEYEKEIDSLKNTRHYEDSAMAFGRQQALEEVVSNLKTILYE